MALPRPRIPPLEAAAWSDEVREMLAKTAVDGRVFNVFATLAQHPKLLKRWMVFANHVLFKSALPARARELLILRTAWHCRSDYEWGQHQRIARAAGLSDEEIQRVAEGPEAPGWATGDAALLRAADELMDDKVVSDATWAALAESLGTDGLMDVVFTVGNYAMLAMALNSFGVERDPGIGGIPGFEG